MHLACLQVFTIEVTVLIIQRFVLVAFNLVSLFGISQNMKLCMGLKLCLLMSASFTYIMEILNYAFLLVFVCKFQNYSCKVMTLNFKLEHFYRGILLGALINWKYTRHLNNLLTNFVSTESTVLIDKKTQDCVIQSLI